MQYFTKEMKRWKEENTNKYLCLCGCRQFVQPTRWRWYNDKNFDYLAGHNPASRPDRYVGHYTKTNGYVLVYCPGHPNADGKGYVREHRLVIENILGRLLRDDEHVHHINEIKSDNRPENLRVLGISEHHLLHAKYGKNHWRWVKVDIKQLVKLRNQGHTFKQLKQELHIGINTVRSRLHQVGLQ